MTPTNIRDGVVKVVVVLDNIDSLSISPKVKLPKYPNTRVLIVVALRIDTDCRIGKRYQPGLSLYLHLRFGLLQQVVQAVVGNNKLIQQMRAERVRMGD